MDATWHARPRDSATRAHAEPTRRCDMCIFIFIVNIGVIVHISIPIIGITLTLNSAHIINPINFFNFLCVGLRSTRHFKLQVTWPSEEPWIEWRNDRRTWIAWTRGPLDLIKRTCLKGGVITALIKSSATHPDRRIAIQGMRFHAFYNASKTASSGRSIKDPTAATFLKRSTMDRSIVTVN